jgi:hypothetical protein
MPDLAGASERRSMSIQERLMVPSLIAALLGSLLIGSTAPSVAGTLKNSSANPTTSPAPASKPGDTTVVVADRTSKLGALQLVSKDGESFQVFVDGKRVAQFMGFLGRSVVIRGLSPGAHTLVVKDFMDDVVFATGRIHVDSGITHELGVTAKNGVEAIDDAAAWEPRR